MSDLIEKLKEVDLENGYLSCRDASYLYNYVVHDIPRPIGDTVKIVFLVESPHTDEVDPENKYPLAGYSGQNVTEKLIFGHSFGLRELTRLRNGDRNISIGKLILENKIPWLAIMNVSLLPLKKNAYNHTRSQSGEMQTLWCAFKEIKRELEERIEGELCPISRNVYDTIVNNLVCRIEQITNQCQPKFIPFGNIARRSLCRVKQIRPSLQALPFSSVKVWHPSKWCEDDYRSRDKHLNCVALNIRNHLRTTS